MKLLSRTLMVLPALTIPPAIWLLAISPLLLLAAYGALLIFSFTLALTLDIVTDFG